MAEIKKENILPGVVTETSSSDSAVERTFDTEYGVVYGTNGNIVEGEVRVPNTVTLSYSSNTQEKVLRSHTDNFDGQIATAGSSFIPKVGDPGDGTSIFNSRQLAREIVRKK